MDFYLNIGDDPLNVPVAGFIDSSPIGFFNVSSVISYILYRIPPNPFFGKIIKFSLIPLFSSTTWTFSLFDVGATNSPFSLTSFN